MMIEGIAVGLKKELLVGPVKLGTPAIAELIWWCRFHLFCVTGLVLVGLASSAAAELVSTNFEAVSYAAADRDTTSMIVTHPPEYDPGPSEGQTLTNKVNRKVTERETTANPGIGVELVCGLALFLWVQRFRNSWV
jgi:hypothetical protein